MTAPPAAGDRTAIFTCMVLMRRFEEEVLRIAQDHPYVGRQHLHIGHEATGAAVVSALSPGDLFHTTHRNHGYVVALGADPGRAFAEIMGRRDGLNKGRGGPWHLCDRSVGMQSTSAMVGGSVGLAVGAGFGLKQQGATAIAVTHFGDGTLDEGICFEAMNLASILSLPVLFLCENNAKEGQRPSSMLAAKALRDLPGALQIHCIVVDGRDADAVAEAATEAVARIRDGAGPVFLQTNLERWPGSHQTKPEFPTGVTDLTLAWEEERITGAHADWVRDHDGLRAFAKTLVADGTLSREQVLAIDREVLDRLSDARAFAEASPYPEPSALLDGVFA
ncbi:MAG: thiamine pyrophosphate-dependent dehydrogenase E1 component subunit alpha [Alphaproteobacteria bacterium]|nr:thiamine pyrophosphate-dependent dehydrogenase E1 component subunit alpha [Alphaproteobacteria bacterium]